MTTANLAGFARPRNAQEGRYTRSPEVDRLAEKLLAAYVLLKSWPKVSVACHVLTPDGKPNPKLAQMIAGGYDPKNVETRTRLDLPPICPACYQKLPKPPRVIPDWLKQAVEILREREQAVPIGPRVYGRGGVRAKAW